MTTDDVAVLAFLHARLAEDEATAQALIDARPPSGEFSIAAHAVAGLPEPLRTHVLAHGPYRVLAEVRIVRNVVAAHPDTACWFAAAYGDHHDYDPDWSPERRGLGSDPHTWRP